VGDTVNISDKSLPPTLRLLHHTGGELMIRLILTILFTNDDYDGNTLREALVIDEKPDGTYTIDWDSSKVHAKDIHEVADTIQNISNILKMQAKSSMEVC
jgi:hypothetical protein